MNIGCIIMASGKGARFGANKLLYPLWNAPLISYTLQAIPHELTPLIVTRSPEIIQLAQQYSIPYLLHTLPDISDTIRLGTRQMLTTDACIYAVADQPLLTRDTFLRLADAYAHAPGRIIRACWQDRPGNPVIFPNTMYPELIALDNGQTGGTVMKRHPGLISYMQVSSERELLDIDTLAQLNALAESNYK